MNPVLWEPSQERREASLLWKFMQSAPAKLETYADVHRWSLEQMEAFWAHFWDFSGVRASCGYDTVLAEPAMPGARWFTGARLNYAENLLAGDADRLAVIGCAEGRDDERLTRGELRQRVARAQAGLRALGLRKGTRVAAFVPNCVETLVLMLATTASGGVWTSCSPDFGAQGVVERFGQVQPQLLIVADGYHYNGKRFALDAKVNGVLEQIPGIEQVIRIPFSGAKGELAHGSVVEYPDLLDNAAAEPEFVPVEFDHPLCIMYSSGTTGPPKSIVHGAGGTLLQHLKEQQLQCDLQPGQRLFWFTTCGWMMWNWLVGSLAFGATALLYDGSPFYPDRNVAFDFAEAESMTLFGTSAKYIDTCNKAGLNPKETHDLSSMRTLGSTGSTLVPEGFDYVYNNIKPDIHLMSMSGGTDIAGCFCGGDPTKPVWRGEIQGRTPGMAADVFDDNGNHLPSGKGELVCTKAFPTVPSFLNDPGDERLIDTYFNRFANTWTHGDFVEWTEHGGMIIHGRSDATLNPAGVRIGTAEIYRQVEKLDEVLESIVIGQNWDNDVRIVLFVILREGIKLDEVLSDRIKEQVKDNCTPRHAPQRVIQVTDIPRTKSGKITELAVRDVVHGRTIKNAEALANPEALDQFKNREELSA